MKLFAKLHKRLGDFWWYSVLLFAATRVVDGLNWINACGLDWVLVAMLSLQLVKASASLRRSPSVAERKAAELIDEMP